MAALFRSNRSVLEFGAGMGCYTEQLRRAGLDVRGFDGSTNVHEITNGMIGRADMTMPTLNLGAADWSYSFEVGEHVPKLHEGTFLRNLVHHARVGVVLSWSNHSGAGRGHVNAQPQQYILQRMRGLGFARDESATRTLRQAIQTTYWIGDTLNVYRRVSPA
jgi:2-polyprenyl-3-methyl-5-hydroxy-6-metoxy-1,4-benzoquinol methylase